MVTSNLGQAQLDLLYDGPAVVDGRMNVRDLAPAMLAVGSLFEAANSRLNGPRASVNVNVRATAAGSFHVVYEVVQSSGDQSLIDTIKTAIELKDLIVGLSGAGGLFGLLKWTRRRKPQINQVNSGLYELTIDGETYECPIDLLTMYQDGRVRNALADIVAPVRTEGIDRFEIRENNVTVQEVTKADLDSFERPEAAEPLTDETSRKAFSILALAFKEGDKWRLSDGQGTYWVTMSDEAFQRRVDNNLVAFAKGDLLVCDLRTRQWQIQDGVKSEYEVVRVVQHRRALQFSLFDQPGVDSGDDTE